MRRVIADSAAQHRIAGLERIQNGRLGGLARDLELHLALDPRERA